MNFLSFLQGPAHPVSHAAHAGRAVRGPVKGPGVLLGCAQHRSAAARGARSVARGEGDYSFKYNLVKFNLIQPTTLN